MKIVPDPEELARYREAGYKVAPVSCELLADICTPIQAVRKLKNVSSHCFLLESAEPQETWGRYTFLGYDPKMSISCVDGEMRVNELKLQTKEPSAVLRQILAEYKSPRFDDLPPFTGGLVGYFSYDYFGYQEPRIDDIEVVCREANELDGAIVVEVAYRVRSTNNRYNRVYPFYRTEGSEGGDVI